MPAYDDVLLTIRIATTVSARLCSRMMRELGEGSWRMDPSPRATEAVSSVESRSGGWSRQNGRRFVSFSSTTPRNSHVKTSGPHLPAEEADENNTVLIANRPGSWHE